MRYSFLLPYYDRSLLLEVTLRSFERFYSNREDWEVVVVEDFKNVKNAELHRQLKEVVEEHDMSVRIVEGFEDSFNPSVLFNLGAKQAQGEFLILSNPECKHTVDILFGLDEEFSYGKDCYVICACRALNEDGTFYRWYQHSEHRNACYHFCSAISQENFWRIGGFDERFKDGYGYDDDAFRDRVARSGIPFIVRDDLVVEHQWHRRVRPAGHRRALRRNKELYERNYGTGKQSMGTALAD